MTSTWMRVAAATFALSVLAALMINAGASSGCARSPPEPEAVKEPPPPSASAPAATAAVASAPASPSAAAPPDALIIPDDEEFMGASKSGKIFTRPRQKKSAPTLEVPTASAPAAGAGLPKP